MVQNNFFHKLCIVASQFYGDMVSLKDIVSGFSACGSQERESMMEIERTVISRTFLFSLPSNQHSLFYLTTQRAIIIETAAGL